MRKTMSARNVQSVLIRREKGAAITINQVGVTGAELGLPYLCLACNFFLARSSSRTKPVQTIATANMSKSVTCLWIKPLSKQLDVHCPSLSIAGIFVKTV